MKNRLTIKGWLKWIGVISGVMVIVGAVIWGFEAYMARKWDGRQRFTIVELADPLTIESFDPATKEGIKVILPKKLVISTVDGRGNWKAEVMSQTAKKFGRVWATDSVCDYLTVPCTALSSDLTWFDKFSWWKWSREIKWKTVNLAETNLVKEVQAPDGEEELVMAANWNEKAYEWFASGSVVRENLNVTVVNSTAVPGLGTHAAKTVETAGMKVAMIKNSDEKISRCRIEAEQETLETLGVMWMIKKFNCETESSGNGVNNVTVFLGEEYARWLLGEDYSSASGISVR